MSNDSNLGYGKAVRRLWHTPAADDLAIAACRSACETASCTWPAPPMPASTTITSAKNWSRRKASRWGVRPFAVCCARPGSPRPANVAVPRIASADSPALAKARWCCSTLAFIAGSKIAVRSSPCSAFWTTPRAKFSSPNSFPPKTRAAIFACSTAYCAALAPPLSFYGDRHGVFVRNDQHWSVQEQLAGRREPTQFGRALDQLGITYIAAQSPQAKGRIERLWGTFQDRLTSELRLAGAHDLDSANQVLRRFLPDHNRRFGRTPRDAQQAWRPAPENLDHICCFHHERSVSNDNVVQWDGRRFQIPPQPQRFSFAGAKVQLYESLEGKVSIYYADTKLHLNGG